MNNPLVTPDLGLIIWTSIVFVILLFLLTKFAWKPILGAVRQREQSIEDALLSAEKAQEEMKQLTAKNEDLLKEARIERDAIMKEANEIKTKILAEAKEKASSEGARIVESARKSIETERMAAVADLKNQVAALSIDIAEKIMKEQLGSDEKQKALVNNLVEDINLN